MPVSRASSAPRRSGLATAFFSLIGLSFGLIGAAQMLNAAQHYRLERRAFDRLRADLAMEGVSNIALARLLVSAGEGPFEGVITDGGLGYGVRVDREDEKMSLPAAGARAGGSVADSLRAAGRGARAGTAQRVVDSFGRKDRAAATCVFFTLSPVSGGAGGGPTVPAGALAQEGDIDWRVGQRWRIAVVSPDGVAFERWLLLSGRADLPGLELMRATHRVEMKRWKDCGGGAHGLA